MIIEAAQFAAEAHRGQLRKYNGRPFIEHPGRVAARVTVSPIANEVTVSAAWLHDVVEDTEVTLDTISGTFGAKIANLVDELTNPSKQHPNLRRAERKAMDRTHIASASNEAKCIKLIDRSDNIRDMTGAEPTFLRLYIDESRLLLDAIGYVSDSQLIDQLILELNTAEAHLRGSQPGGQ
ncbi:MAG: HD domain-containing protein [Planctomycetia bacterium]|nr:HD domain-containing protein [Planctomycetia bacterium]